MTLTYNYAHTIMKQKKTKTDYLRSFCLFVFIVNKCGPSEKPISHSKAIKEFLVFGNPDETLALVYETWIFLV